MGRRRELSPTQHRHLEQLAADDPEARVVGWGDSERGPLVRTSAGSVYAIVRPGPRPYMRHGAVTYPEGDR